MQRGQSIMGESLKLVFATKYEDPPSSCIQDMVLLEGQFMAILIERDLCWSFFEMQSSLELLETNSAKESDMLNSEESKKCQLWPIGEV